MIADAKKQIILAIAGNPNCGKTTIFNGLTGSRQRVGNWPGVTVEKKEGILVLDPVKHLLAEAFLPGKSASPGTTDEFRNADGGGKIRSQTRVVDLPGIYGLSAQSDDEKVARDYLLSGEADLVIDIVDAANLERNLFLTLQLLEMGLPVLVVLNMMDLADEKGYKIDLPKLSAELGVPVVAVKGTDKNGIADIKTSLRAALAELPRTKLRIPYDAAVESALGVLGGELAPVAKDLGVEARWFALGLLEKNEELTKMVVSRSSLTEEKIDAVLRETEEALGEEADVVIADEKYSFIEKIVASSLKKAATKVSLSDRIDKVAMNRFAGLPLFLFAMYLVFWVTISIGGAFIDFFDILFGAVFVDGFGALLGAVGSPPWLTALLATGVGGGIQTVSTFVPIIFAMFFMLSLLEDSGYMARAAFVMDRLMRKIGLPGKAFVPMLLGFGCSIPAIMATRTLDTKRDKFTTIFMAPLMSCGARLPVYALFAAALFPTLAGTVVFSLYLVGILVSVLTGLLLKNTLFKGESSHFVMELPPYHSPRLKSILSYTFTRLFSFIKRAGITITAVVLLLSFFNTLGWDERGLSFGNEDTEESVLAALGKGITPVFEPMGIREENWPATVGLFTGLFAKEAVVGTVNSLYGASLAREEKTAEIETQDQAGVPAEGDAEGPAEEGGFALGERVAEAFETIPANLSGVFGSLLDPLGLGIVTGDEASTSEELATEPATFEKMRSLFDVPGAYAYLLFVLIYFPCVAALGTAVQEMGARLGWALGGYLTALAWAVATLFYQVSVARNPLWIGTALAVVAGLVLAFSLTGKKMGRLRETEANQ